jgi:hypothetical protein
MSRGTENTADEGSGRSDLNKETAKPSPPQTENTPTDTQRWKKWVYGGGLGLVLLVIGLNFGPKTIEYYFGSVEIEFKEQKMQLPYDEIGSLWDFVMQEKPSNDDYQKAMKFLSEPHKYAHDVEYQSAWARVSGAHSDILEEVLEQLETLRDEPHSYGISFNRVLEAMHDGQKKTTLFNCFAANISNFQEGRISFYECLVQLFEKKLTWKTNPKNGFVKMRNVSKKAIKAIEEAVSELFFENKINAHLVDLFVHWIEYSNDPKVLETSREIIDSIEHGRTGE